ncbi:MAG: SDR family oxidoreductase [Xanthomonadales bacterium]|nr:SDR family oxidoreductase [Xanthomonadales bacterium]
MNTPMSRWRLEGQTALICGASKGIGRACARELAMLGANVLMVARDDVYLETVRSELAEEFPACNVLAMAANLSESEPRLQVFDWVADLGLPLSLLVNNVGTNVSKPVLDYSASEVNKLIQTNVLTAFEMCRLAHAQLSAHPNAAIVNVGSVAALTHVRTGAPYGMSKAAIHQMTRNLACEWADDGIRVNAVAPWYIRTQRSELALADADYLDEVLERTPLGRIGEPEDVAAAVAFLCLPAAAYVTGQVIAVDGGFVHYGF